MSDGWKIEKFEDLISLLRTSSFFIPHSEFHISFIQHVPDFIYQGLQGKILTPAR